MPSVTLLQRTPLGVMVESVDVRGGTTVEDIADATRAEMVGRAMIDWWMNATREWVMYLVDMKTGKRDPLDLRLELLRELTRGYRISSLAGYLRVVKTPDGGAQSQAKNDAAEHASEIGRDLVAWYHEGRSDRLRTLLNQSWANYQHRRERERGRAA